MKQVLIVVAFFISNFAHAAPLELRLRSSQVNKGEVFSLELVCESSDCEIVSDLKFPGVELVNVANFESSTGEIRNWKLYSKTVKTWTLSYVPQKVGKLEIPSYRVKVDGKEHLTKKMEITVGDGVAKRPNTSRRNQPLNSTAPIQNQDYAGTPAVFMERDLKSQSIYVGQSTEASIRLYFETRPQKLSLVDGEVVDFAEVELHKNQLQDRETIDGVEYQVIELRQFVTGKKEGDYTLPSFSLQYAVPVRGRGIFMPLMDRKIVNSNKNKIKILPLPEGASKEFIGAVGNYRITSSLSEPSIEAGNTITFQVTLEGKGDLRGIVLPEPKTHDSIKVYSDKPQESYKVDFEDGPLSRVDFKFALVPSQPGDYKIEGYAVEVFDPQKKKYQKLATDPVAFKVTGSVDPSVIDVKQFDQSKNTVEVKNAELLDLMRVGGAGGSKELQGMLGILTWVFFALGGLVFVGAFFLAAKSKGFIKLAFGNKKSRALSNLRDAVDASRKCESSDEEVILSVFASFKEFLGGAFGLYGAALTDKEISELLDRLNASENDVRLVEGVLKVVNDLTYGGKMSSGSDAATMVNDLLEVASRLIKEAR